MPLSPPAPHASPRKFAVVGSGISGLSAAWLLSQHHHVTLYEADARLGGHTNTVTARTPDGDVAVDTGFIVFNAWTYPNLCRLFDDLGVESVESDMGFAVSMENGAFEYSGSGLSGLFASRRNAIRPRFWSLVRDLLRFYKEAPKDAADAVWADKSLGAYLAHKGYGTAFIRDHLLPMAAAIWSTPSADVDAFPLRAFVNFCVNHGLLSLTDRPQWRTLKGGSKSYIPHLTKGIQNIRLNAGISQVIRESSGVTLVDATGHSDHFDGVLIATHAKEALAMLAAPTKQEQELLGAFGYSRNHAVLHSDPSLMPKRRRAWASWDVIEDTEADRHRLCVSYWMNKLQPLETRTDLFVTLNPNRVIDPDLVQYEVTYEHPIFDTSSMAAQQTLWGLQGSGGVWYAGAHFGYGFHEDGLQSGLKAAEEMGGIARPWHIPGMNDRILGLDSAGRGPGAASDVGIAAE